MLFAHCVCTAYVKLLFRQQSGLVASKKSSIHILDNESFPQIKIK